MKDIELFLCWLVYAAAWEAARGDVRHPTAPARLDLCRSLWEPHHPGWSPAGTR